MPSSDSIKEQALDRKKQHKKLLMNLGRKPGKKVDSTFQAVHDEVFSYTNCLECANCCKTTSPLFREADIRVLARHLRLKEVVFIDRYLQKDEENDWVLKSSPCPFLGSDNYCSVYDARPKACREYPHTDRKNIQGILGLTLKNAEVCPAVFDMLERLDDSAVNKSKSG